jgi:7-cyano-7-deazaguanine synthase
MSVSTPAVVLLSGGLDSAVALACARASGYACHALSFDYGQRHRHELAAAGRVARHLGAADHRTVAIDLRAIGGSALTADIPVPKRGTGFQPVDQPATGAAGPREGHGLEARATIPITYVPARNLIFLSVAAAYAETVGASDIFIGVNAVDYSGYPDCRRPFIDAFERAAGLGTRAGDSGGCFRVQTPLVSLTKAAIIRRGAELGVDFSLTHSCYDPDASGLACGRCDSCVIRARGFAEAGVPDPTRYARAPEPAAP